MANYKFYKKDTGEIASEHQGHPHDKDPLTKDRQKQLILNMGETEYYNTGIIVSEGYNALFFPDVVENRKIKITMKDINGSDKETFIDKKFIKKTQLDKLNR